jgi:putative dimethyl sulfoxide reductase chaperone
MESLAAAEPQLAALPKRPMRAGVQLLERARGRTARCRSMLYSMLAQALCSPSEGLCSAVEEGEFFELVGFAVAGLPPKNRQELGACTLDRLVPGEGGVSFAESILLEYTRLFSQNLHCPQYEADYLAPNADNAVHVIAKVANMYSIFGMRLATDAAERPDHIAVELDFMNLLAAKEAHASHRGQAGNARLCRRAQARFLSDHLSRWGSAFARSLGEVSLLPFYRGVAELLEDFIVAEAKYLRVERRTDPFEQEVAVCNQSPTRELIKITGLGKTALRLRRTSRIKDTREDHP